jgi:hypothetical protein
LPNATQIQQLNLSDAGLSENIMTTIVKCTVRINACNGVNIEENRRKGKETAQAAIDSKAKRYSGGHHFAVS